MTNGAAADWVNPLRDKRDKRMPRVAGPCAVVIFGVTGDLARKKLMPAIYDLANRGLLAPQFALVGFARRDWADEHFGEVVLEAVKEHSRTPFRQEVWDRLAEGIRFVHGDFDDEDAFARLADTLHKLDVDRGTGGHIVNVASMAAYAPMGSMSAYCTSKAAVYMFSDCLRAELDAAGVGLTTNCPGVINTNIVSTTAFHVPEGKRTKVPGRRAQVEKMFAARNYGPDKVATAILAAVRKNTPIRPVSPEAYLVYGTSRLAPQAPLRSTMVP